MTTPSFADELRDLLPPQFAVSDVPSPHERDDIVEKIKALLRENVLKGETSATFFMSDYPRFDNCNKAVKFNQKEDKETTAMLTALGLYVVYSDRLCCSTCKLQSHPDGTHYGYFVRVMK